MLIAASGATAAAAPKWGWTPAKIERRLMAAKPFVGDLGVSEVHCRGTGKTVAGRYQRFVCDVSSGGGVNVHGQTVPVVVRVLPVGPSGKFCFPLTPRGLTQGNGDLGVRVVEGRGCP